jgi:hypothetical protein
MILRRSFTLLAAALACACGSRADRHAAARTLAADSRPAATTAPAPATMAADPDTADDDVVPAGPPPRIRHLPQPDPLRGIYVSRSAAEGLEIWKLVALAHRTGINAFVIDVKDDAGRLLYPSTVGLAHAIGADSGETMSVARVHALMDTLRAHRIFAIARIVVGRDPLLAAHHPEWAVRRRDDGAPWRDSTGALWLDPSHRAVWAYAADLASEAVARGFGEVEFDDVRFPDLPGMRRDAQFARDAGHDRAQIIGDRLAYLQWRTDPLGVPTAITIAGTAATEQGDLGIGQRWEAIADRADVIMPREFPSAFPSGYYGMADPAEHPYETVAHALADAKRRSAAVRAAAKIVPWYQDFTLGAPPYDSARVREQIRAGYEAGIRSWLLWNPGSTYTESALREPVRRRDTTAAKPVRRPVRRR